MKNYFISLEFLCYPVFIPDAYELSFLPFLKYFYAFQTPENAVQNEAHCSNELVHKN